MFFGFSLIYLCFIFFKIGGASILLEQPLYPLKQILKMPEIGLLFFMGITFFLYGLINLIISIRFALIAKKK